MPTSLGLAALDLAHQGYSVFPLIAGGKVPSLRADWRQISDTDPDVVGDWPDNDNIAVDTGKSGLIVVDVDVKSGNGYKPWKSLLARNGLDDWPETLTVRTASGGAHFYFSAGDVEMRNSASMIAPHIDIRAQGGYVVSPPSVVDGKPYTILHDDPVLPVPDWLVRHEAVCRSKQMHHAAMARETSSWSMRMMSRSAVRAKIDGLSRKLSEAASERNNLLNWAAGELGKLAAAGQVTEDDAWDVCRRACELNGLAADDGAHSVRATFDSGFSHGYRGDL